MGLAPAVYPALPFALSLSSHFTSLGSQRMKLGAAEALVVRLSSPTSLFQGPYPAGPVTWCPPRGVWLLSGGGVGWCLF